MPISFLGSHVGTHAATSAQTVNFSSLLNESGAAPTLRHGDLVVVAVNNAATADRTAAQLLPSGYTSAHADLYADDSNDTNLLVSYRFMGATPDTSVSIPASAATTAGIAYAIYVFRGVDPQTPLDVTPATTTGANTGVANAPSITPATAGAWIMAVGAAAVAAGAVFTNPAGMSTTTNHFRSATITSTTNDANIGVALLTTWSSGAYDPAAFGGSTSTNTGSWAAVTLALRPLVGSVSFPLDFTGASLPAGVVFTRSGTGAYLNGSSVLAYAASHVPRFSYLVNNAYAAGTAALLYEPLGFNLVYPSEDLSDARWTKSRCTITANSATAPDGTTTADAIVEDTQTGNHGVEQVVSPGGGVVRQAVFLKANTRGYAWVQVITDGYTNRYGIAIDLSNGSVGSTSSQGSPVSPGYRVENWGSGWYRAIVWATNTSGASGGGFGPATSASPTWNAFAQPSHTGDGSSSIFAWGANVDTADTTYLPTTTGTNSRSGDVMSFTVPSAGTLRFGFDDGSTQDVIVSGGFYTVPTTLNRSRIRSIGLTSPVYKGARTRSQAYLGTRTDSQLYKGARSLFP